MPEKIKEVKALIDDLHALPESAQQRVLGIVEGIQLARSAERGDGGDGGDGKE